MREIPALTCAALAIQSDERLVALARAGSDAAFATIVERYRRQLQRHSARIFDSHRAEDLVQQAFLNLYLQLRDDDRPLQLKPWLFRVTHNLTLNEATRKGGDHDELFEDLDGVPQPPQVAELRARLRATVDVIGALPERQRIALVRRELEGRSCDEIAAEVGTSPVAVRQLLARARTAVRDRVGLLLPFPLVARISGAAQLGAGAGALGGGAAVKVAMTVMAVTAATGIVPSGPSAGGGPPAFAESASPSASVDASVNASVVRPHPRALTSKRRPDRPPRDEPRVPVAEQPAFTGSGVPLPQPAPADPPSEPPDDAAREEPVLDEPTAEDAGSANPSDEQEAAPYKEPPPDDPGEEKPPVGASEGESVDALPLADPEDDHHASAPEQALDAVNGPDGPAPGV